MSSTQLVECRPPIDEVIVVEQLPIIRQQLELMRNSIQQDVDTALSLSVTDETVKQVKAVRSRLNNDFKTLEKARIDVKKKILLPYEQFESIYKECISSIYGSADVRLKQKIDEVEDGLKNAKQLEIESYFTEYCNSKNIDFLTFERTGIVVTLSASKKGLKTQVKSFIDKVSDDLAFIATQDNAVEVLVEYKKSLNVMQALTTVANRHKALEEEQLRLEQAQEKEKVQQSVVQKVDAVIQDTVLQAPSVAAPLQVPVASPVQVSSEKILTTKFTVRGTKTQLLALRRFLLDGGYDFE